MSAWLALVVSWALTAWLASDHSPIRLHDAPNARSLHQRPTPRTGGLAIISGIVVGWSALAWRSGMPEWLPTVAIAAALVAIVSFLDDLLDLSPAIRLPAHLLAAAIVVAGGALPPWGAIAGGLLLAWMLNLYNFMDGMDGFAGGMSVAGFLALAWAGWQAGDASFAIAAGVVAGASAGFLFFNFPPARIFMGDVGSATLGLLAGALSWQGWRAGLFSWWFPLLVFSPFVVDATVTLVRRILRGERIWQAHRSHYYQRLVLSGWSHRRTVLAEYGLMLAAGGSAAWLLSHRDWAGWIIACWVLIYGVLALAVEGKARDVRA